MSLSAAAASSNDSPLSGIDGLVKKIGDLETELRMLNASFQATTAKKIKKKIQKAIEQKEEAIRVQASVLELLKKETEPLKKAIEQKEEAIELLKKETEPLKKEIELLKKENLQQGQCEKYHNACFPLFSFIFLSFYLYFLSKNIFIVQGKQKYLYSSLLFIFRILFYFDQLSFCHTIYYIFCLFTSLLFYVHMERLCKVIMQSFIPIPRTLCSLATIFC
jgi:hypothetical protein